MRHHQPGRPCHGERRRTRRAKFIAGRRRLARKIRRWRPATVAFLGVGAYALAFGLRKTPLGPQPARFAGAAVWVLPNPSGLNANYQLAQLVQLFRAVRKATGQTAPAKSQGSSCL
ncbi:MAG TPA: uracil-DNA glycosylase family protein [Burkholderiales bacterium]|nr:uracil-DNA glycosylase family protein [Burkholderiales bacterium]